MAVEFYGAKRTQGLILPLGGPLCPWQENLRVSVWEYNYVCIHTCMCVHAQECAYVSVLCVMSMCVCMLIHMCTWDSHKYESVICAYVCMHIYVHVCTCVSVWICTHGCYCVHVGMGMHVRICVHMNEYVCQCEYFCTFCLCVHAFHVCALTLASVTRKSKIESGQHVLSLSTLIQGT